MFFDSHAHFSAGDPEAEAALDRARRAAVERVMVVGGSPDLNAGAIRTVSLRPDVAVPAIGLDRDQADERAGRPEGLGSLLAGLEREIERLAAEGTRVRAVGEIGLDFHYRPQTSAEQIALFREQLRLARRMGLPVIVHSREAERETLSELRAHREAWNGPEDRVGVLHCFTGGNEFAGRLLDMGYDLGFSGIVTFRNAGGLREVAAGVPDDRLLIETDTPYLTPVPLRGRPNEPAYVRHVAEALAKVRGTAVDRLASLTCANARRLFLAESPRCGEGLPRPSGPG